MAITNCPAARFARAAQRNRDDLVAAANHRQIGIWIVADQFGVEAVACRSGDESGAPVNDVAVGQDEAIRREHEARTRASAACLLHLDVHDSRTNPLHRADYRARVTIQQLQVGMSRSQAASPRTEEEPMSAIKTC